MAINKRFCETHPGRLAIGVCVITGRAICEECSTRYEGVNYSLEGLRILQERRAAEVKWRASRGRSCAFIAFIAATPVLLLLLSLAYHMLADIILFYMNR